MSGNIFTFEVDGKKVLGFDTGLDAQAFAQAKMAQFITQRGFLVRPDGTAGEWKSSGVVEHKGSMVIWGPFFEGQRLDFIMDKPDKAFAALRFWMEARFILGEQKVSPWPAGALVSDSGSVLFPPERLVLRCLQAERSLLSSAEPFVHPDLAGGEAAAFTAAAILYRIISGNAPFHGDSEEKIHEDIREGVYLPLRLAVPGADEKLSALVDRTFAPIKNRKEKGTSLSEFRTLLGTPRNGKDVSSLVHPVAEDQRKKIEAEREQYSKNKARTVGTRRFIVRNTAIILGAAAAAAVLLLVARSIIAGRAGLPTTQGMTSLEVVNAWYGAFENLDHTLMEACAVNRAGKDDIQMITNFFVLTRVRQAYEYNITGTLPAREWVEQGSPPSELPVFGVTDLRITKIAGDEEEGPVRYRAAYTLWVPAGGGGEEGSPPAEAGPVSYPRVEELILTRLKGSWRISAIDRIEG